MVGSTAEALAHAVEHAGHLLPAQGPIRVFIHHNTLHAFEDLPFEEAVVRAGERFGCQPFLPESEYREQLHAGRILADDVAAVLADEVHEGDRVAGIPRALLRRELVVRGLPEASGVALRWRLAETGVLHRSRQSLWRACLDAVSRAPAPSRRDPPPPRRHRDLLQLVEDVDIDAWIHPLLIRFTSAYLDQGLAYWPMPERDRGLHACFLDLYGSRIAALAGAWARRLPALVADDRDAARNGEQSVLHSLQALGVDPNEWPEFLGDTCLALRGFAGLVHQLELRPDRVTTYALPATLTDFLAVRLLLERAAIAHAIDDVPLGDVRAHLRARLSPPAVPTIEERAWPLLHVAELLCLDAAAIDALDAAELEHELLAFDHVECRRVLHLAYERRLRRRFYDALAGHPPRPQRVAPAFQAIFCIDEREESIRRHLEEVDPDAETLGAAGFFGVSMYHRSAGDAHPRPLCPVAIVPEHYVEEAADDDPLALRSRRVAGLLGHNIDLGSRTLVRGALLMTLLGALALVPLVLGVAFPWLARRLRKLKYAPPSRGPARLLLERRSMPPPIGRHTGFTVAEMAAIVRRLLEDTGVGSALAPLCLVIGHGSVSLNNPHESAHDCGACGGGHGGPNARAFALMANDARVRETLAAQGLAIPDSTWFVGGERNSANNAIELYDEDLAPDTLHSLLARAHASLDLARRREAHERCRRFDGVPHWYPAGLALAHVEARAADLAQPRPEYGHATNALCVVGRRMRTRGLFLDRRAFLVSYDPSTDVQGEILARLLAAVVPVVAGISLEYYFGRVDPTGYGCGTKLPHNITALLGVMDGAQSDLRPGLPWQMVEIHEPVRLTIVVETSAERLQRVVHDNPLIERLVRNRWIVLARVDPDETRVYELGPRGFTEHEPDHRLPSVAGGSLAWYAGERDHLPIAALEPD